MKDLTLFGTEEWPIHPSGIKTLLICPWRAVMPYLFGGEDESGPAADTGSATHKAVQELHRGKETAVCVKVMAAERAKYPAADLREAAEMFLNYAADQRNAQARIVAVEKPIQFDIAPSPEDKTGEPIRIVGTLDQIREDEDGVWRLYDLKTSKKDPIDLLNHHIYQIAAYCVGASFLFSRPVHPGALILPRRYKPASISTSPVFYRFTWRLEHTDRILAPLRHVVARIRAGDIWHMPTDDCRWCAQRSPDICFPKLLELGR